MDKIDAIRALVNDGAQANEVVGGPADPERHSDLRLEAFRLAAGIPMNNPYANVGGIQQAIAAQVGGNSGGIDHRLTSARRIARFLIEGR